MESLKEKLNNKEDMPTTIKNSLVLQYADDTKIMKSIGGIEDETKLQEDINNFASWCSSSVLNINQSKTKHVRFSRRIIATVTTYQVNLEEIQQEKEMLDLGIIFDWRLSFRKHIAAVIVKGNLILDFIRRRFKEIKNKEIALLLYKWLVLPVIEYRAIIWSPSTIAETGLIELIQKKLTRILLKVPPNPSSEAYVNFTNGY